MVSLPVIPPMRCDDGCGACCGPVICSEKDYAAVKREAARNGVKPIMQGVMCPYYQGGKCAVYNARPLVCRLFGHSDKLVCKHGYNVNVSERVERQMMVAYKPTRWLHETLGSQGIEALHKALIEETADARHKREDQATPEPKLGMGAILPR